MPLNNALAEAADPQTGAGISWLAYESRWTRWNSIRTVLATVVTALLLLVLAGF